MLIFGLSTKQVLMATLVYVCEVCGNNAAHQLVRRMRRFTLFFIPILPLGSSYSDTCTFCARTIGVSREQAENAVAARGSAELR